MPNLQIVPGKNEFDDLFVVRRGLIERRVVGRGVEDLHAVGEGSCRKEKVFRIVSRFFADTVIFSVMTRTI